MVQKKIEEKSNLTYDDRKKILIQKKSQIVENKTDEIKEGEEITEKSKLI